MASLHVSIAPEEVLEVGGLVVTNSTLTTVVVTGLVGLFAWYAGSRVKASPSSNFLVTLGELVVEMWISLCKSVGGERGMQFFPIVTSIFIFVLVSNWSGLVPGVGTYGWKPVEEIEDHVSSSWMGEVLAASESGGESEVTTLDSVIPEELREGAVESAEEEEHHGFVPLFRAPTADLNTTVALAVIAVVYIQYMGIKTFGGSVYAGKFFNFSSGINAFVGLLELVSEFSKVVSFAFRLFGNIFAGEVLLAVIAFLTTSVLSLPVLPFIGLEIFVGFIQAFVFAILTLVFVSQAVVSHDH